MVGSCFIVGLTFTVDQLRLTRMSLDRYVVWRNRCLYTTGMATPRWMNRPLHTLVVLHLYPHNTRLFDTLFMVFYPF